MDWNLTRPILARGGVTHNRLAMKRWGHKLQLSAPVQVDVFKLQVATISKDMSSSRWLFWYCEFCAGLTPYSPFQSFSYLCGSKGTPQLWYTQFPEFLVKIPKLVASNPALFAKSDPGCFKTRTVIVGPKHSSCCCLQFACLTPMFVAQDPDPCSFKPVLIPWFLASQHPDLSPAPIIFHIFLQESSTFSSELAVGKVSELWWTLRTSATWTKSIWTYTVCIYIYMKLIKHDQTIPESPSQCTEKKIFEGETSDGRNTETPRHHHPLFGGARGELHGELALWWWGPATTQALCQIICRIYQFKKVK